MAIFVLQCPVASSHPLSSIASILAVLMTST